MNLPRKPIGNSDVASVIGRIIDYVKSLPIQPGVGYKVKRSTTGTRLEIDNRVPPQKKRLAINAVYGDYILCNPKVGTITDTLTDIYVAKNPKLRTSITVETLDGTAHTYTYTGYIQRNAVFSGTTETQYVVPRYLTSPPDEIFAEYVETNVTTTLGDSIHWMDSNVDARAWASDSA